MESIYNFTVKNAQGEMVSLEKFEGKPLIIVNTASKCGLTPQFEELQTLYGEYQQKGLEILGFPSAQFNNQEFENLDETMEFCKKNYGVEFPMFAKVDVKGENAEPLFKYLVSSQKDSKNEEIEWNFAKFLINKEGEVVKRYSPKTSPKEIEEDLLTVL